MPTLNFQKEFAGEVERGEKKQSIRAWRKRPFQLGDTVYLYTGLRTKQCRKLGEGEVTFVAEVCIDTSVSIAGVEVDKTVLAKKDGFENFKELTLWFEKTHGLPFSGQLIQWDLK